MPSTIWSARPSSTIALEQLRGPVGPSPPRNEPSYSGDRAGRPGARDGDPGRRPCRRGDRTMWLAATPRSARNRTWSMAPVPSSQWVRIGTPVRPWAIAAAANTRRRAPRAALGARDLEHAGPMLRPADERPRVVVRVDAVVDVGDEQVGQLVHRDPLAPVRGAVVAVVMEASRRDDVDARPVARSASLPDIPPGVARHRIDDGPQPEPDRRPPPPGPSDRIVELEIGRIDRSAAR